MDNKKLTRMRNKFQRALKESTITGLARRCGFTQRLRTILPHELVTCLIAAMATQKIETLADIVRLFNAFTDKDVAYKPFHKQLSKEAFAELMRQVVGHLLNELVMQVMRPIPRSVLRRFRDIIIQDGSSFALKDTLQEAFPGRFTKISPAAVEIHATMSVFHDQLLSVAIAPDKEGERQFLPNLEELKGHLLLADCGYQNAHYCEDLKRHGASFIVRHQSGIGPVVLNSYRGKRRVRKHAGKRLQKLVKKYRGVDFDIDADWFGVGNKGGKHTNLRVVALWNPTEREYIMLVTNLDRSQFPPRYVLQLYRLRWQVELLFKEWKSYANLHRFDTSRAPIAEGLIWSALAASIVKRFFAHATQYTFVGSEISTRLAAMATPLHLQLLFVALIRQRNLAAAFLQVVSFLGSHAQRAHPKRDRRQGRLQPGLRPVYK
jgi:hypothetical protein